MGNLSHHHHLCFPHHHCPWAENLLEYVSSLTPRTGCGVGWEPPRNRAGDSATCSRPAAHTASALCTKVPNCLPCSAARKMHPPQDKTVVWFLPPPPHHHQHCRLPHAASRCGCSDSLSRLCRACHCCPGAPLSLYLSKLEEASFPTTTHPLSYSITILVTQPAVFSAFFFLRATPVAIWKFPG